MALSTAGGPPPPLQESVGSSRGGGREGPLPAAKTPRARRAGGQRGGGRRGGKAFRGGADRWGRPRTLPGGGDTAPPHEAPRPGSIGSIAATLFPACQNCDASLRALRLRLQAERNASVALKACLVRGLRNSQRSSAFTRSPARRIAGVFTTASGTPVIRSVS